MKFFKVSSRREFYSPPCKYSSALRHDFNDPPLRQFLMALQNAGEALIEQRGDRYVRFFAVSFQWNLFIGSVGSIEFDGPAEYRRPSFVNAKRVQL